MVGLYFRTDLVLFRCAGLVDFSKGITQKNEHDVRGAARWSLGDSRDTQKDKKNIARERESNSSICVAIRSKNERPTLLLVKRTPKYVNRTSATTGADTPREYR